MSRTSSVGSRTRLRLVASILGATALAALPGSALAVTRSSEVMKAASDRAARVFFDSRSGDRASVRQAQSASRAAGSRVRAARAAELKRLGAGGKLQLDPLTGTPRSFQNFSGALAGPTGGSPASVAMGFARSQRRDPRPLQRRPRRSRSTQDRHVAERHQLGALAQNYEGVPAYDNGLRINLDRVNRVLSVRAPRSTTSPSARSAPKLSADAGALRADAPRRRAPRSPVKSASSDARRGTTFSNGDLARLVLFHGKSGTRLAWT